MGFFDSLFSDTKKQETNSSQSGSSSFGMSPEIAKYWQSISGQYAPGAWQSQGPDSYQSSAAASQAGYAAGLAPAFAGANNIGANGIATSDISRFQNPYEQQVVDSAVGDIRDQAAVTGAQSEAAAAKMGALGGTAGINRNMIRSRDTDNTIADTTAKLRHQGFTTAAGLAKDSTGAQIAGLGAASGIAGQQAGINQGQFGMGSTLWGQGWQNAMAPYNIGQMGAQTLSGLTPLSGQSSTGTSSGTSTMTATPSPFSVGMNLTGLGMQGWGMFKADGGRVSMADGGRAGQTQSDPHERFRKAYDTISSLLERAKGGSVMKPYADGGNVGPWETTVTPASRGVDWKSMGQRLQKMGQPAQQGAYDDGSSALRDSQANLSQFMQTLRPRFDGGGTVDWSETGPVFDDTPSGLNAPSYAGVSRSELPSLQTPSREAGRTPEREESFLSRILPDGLKEGIWAGKEATPMQRLGTAFMSVQSPTMAGPLNGFAKNMMDWNQDQLARRQVDQAAEQFQKRLAHDAALASGTVDINGRPMPTLQAKQLGQSDAHWRAGAEGRDADIALKKAQAKAIEAKENDPIAGFIAERLKGLQPGPAANSPRVPPVHVPGGPRLIPQSFEGGDPATEPGDAKVVLTQAADDHGPVAGPPKASTNTFETPLGSMSREQARQLGGAMLASPKYHALGKELLDSIKEADKAATSAGAVGNISKSTMTDINKKEVNSAEGLARLGEINRLYKPEYQTWDEGIKQAGLSFVDSIGPLRGRLTDEQRKGLADFTTFKATALGHLNDYIKEITGAAMSDGEAQRIRKAVADTEKDSPTQFKAKLDQGMRLAELALYRHAYTRKTGKPWNESGISLDQMERLIEQRTRQLRDEARGAKPKAPADKINADVATKLKQEFGI